MSREKCGECSEAYERRFNPTRKAKHVSGLRAVHNRGLWLGFMFGFAYGAIAAIVFVAALIAVIGC